MAERKILKDEIALIECVKKNIDANWDVLTPWEKRFCEDIIEKYCQYNSNMLISKNQIDRLLEISEKLI